jgi:urease accessory protein
VRAEQSLLVNQLSDQLALKLECDAAGKTVLRHCYMAYPLSVSPIFRLEANESGASSSAIHRAYLYRMNTSPGLLAGDALKISLNLAAGAQLYLADQSATKVHSMPQLETFATVDYRIEVGEGATLEFLPEPLILFADAELVQKTEITLHETAGLSLGEIILPGRLARGEVYQFREYLSRLQIKSGEGETWFVEAMKLMGKDNRFVQSPLFASAPVLGTLVLILPQAIATPQTLTNLSAEIDRLAENEPWQTALSLASSPLPGNRGLFIRAISTTTRDLQACFKAALNCVRKLRNQAPLPYSLV